jgi:hypothetical protein
MRAVRVILGLSLLGSLSPLSGLSYVESSNGLGDPALEGGRTELEFADIDNDGNVDILSIGDHGNPYVNTQEHGIMTWFGDGLGNWTVYQIGGFGYGGIAVGDVNNDGKWDVGVGMHHNYAPAGELGTKIMDIGIGDGTGRNWTPWDTGLATHGETWGMFGTAFADFNNDGWLDAAWNSFGGSAGVHVYLNQHNGHWDQSFGFTGGMSKCDIATGDINNDGNPDFVVGQQYGSVYLGDGAGNFTLKDRNLPVPSGQQGRGGVALGDVDSDGAKEFSFVDSLRGIDVWKWDQPGDSWTNIGGTLPGSGYQSTQLCDMDCDGNVDLVGFGYGSVTVWLGDGAGDWTQAASFTTPGSFTALRAGGDVDHNGFPDIALVGSEATRNVLHCFRETSVAETLRVTPVFPRGGERFYGGAAQFIDWVCAVPAGDGELAHPASVRLDFSVTGPGGPWSPVASSLENSGRYQWTVPNSPSTDCYIRHVATSSHAADTAITSRPFTILPTLGLSERRTARPNRELSVSVVPNPVRDVAALHYEMPVQGRIRIILYDAVGRELGVRHVGTEPAGRHVLALNATPLSPGVYFCRVQTEWASVTLKFMVAGIHRHQ